MQKIDFESCKTPLSKPTRPVWDRVTRISHWVLAVLILGMWVSAEWNYMSVHVTLGLIIVSLIVFRIYWGFFGSSTARFSTFIKSPAATVKYALSLLKPGYRQSLGHNALGGWSVLAMLTALLVQTVSGLFAVDTDGFNSGPLARFIDFKTGRSAANIHELSFNVLLALIVIHILAIALYALTKKTNLVGPMLSGRSSVSSAESRAASLKKSGNLTLFAGLAIAGGTGALLFWL